MNKLPIAIILMMLLSGCVSSSQVLLSVASSKAKPENITILKKDVKGDDCSSIMPFYYGSYSAAINNALQKVEGSNVLVNAQFSRREMPLFRICVTVEGDAGKL